MTARLHLRLAFVVAAIAILAGCVVYEPSPGRPLPPPPPRPPAVSPVAVNVAFFYDSLDPDGDWLWIEPYGWVWAPNAVAPFWRPYTVGRWEWTDWGWTWVSSERWGWATYHYGRWIRVNRHGWVWIPGEVWGPAWVAWRNGPGVVGWAPLPPEVRFRAGVGLDWGDLDIDVVIRLDHWCFVDDGRFANADIDRYAYPVGRNTTAIRGTRNATRVRVDGTRIINEGVDRNELERTTQRTIPARRVVGNPRSDRRRAEITTEEIRVFQPEVRPAPAEAAPARGRKPAEHARPPDNKQIEVEAERRWDHRWNKDWDKLEKLQRPYEPVNPPPPGRPRPGSLEKVRDENMEAAENAYRELLAERERAKRQAERGPRKAAPKTDDKGREKKD